jgi:hypothetical protein
MKTISVGKSTLIIMKNQDSVVTKKDREITQQKCTKKEWHTPVISDLDLLETKGGDIPKHKENPHFSPS